jgi:hypothetical protein
MRAFSSSVVGATKLLVDAGKRAVGRVEFDYIDH